MAAADYDILIEQGSTFILPIVWKDSNGVAINVTGYTARMQVRKTVKSTDILISATTENGRIVLGGATGAVTVTIPATITDDITVKSAVYDLEMVSASGVVTRLIQGAVTISPEVTRG